MASRLRQHRRHHRGILFPEKGRTKVHSGILDLHCLCMPERPQLLLVLRRLLVAEPVQGQERARRRLD